eukprot:1157711-Pelagomonas_calceolata.AAC.27
MDQPSIALHVVALASWPAKNACKQTGADQAQPCNCPLGSWGKAHATRDLSSRVSSMKPEPLAERRNFEILRQPAMSPGHWLRGPLWGARQCPTHSFRVLTIHHVSHGDRAP